MRSNIIVGAATAVLSFCASACGEHEPTADDIAAWEAAYEENEAGKADDNRCSGVLVPDRSGFGKKVALTFDDGPNPATTPDVLDTLAERGIRATFFINGSRVTSQEHRDLLDRIVAEGHILANHSHRHRQLSTLSASEVRSEIELTHEIIADHVETPRYFRFPFGASTCATAETARSFGLVVTGWHVDSADWCYASSTGGVGFCHPSTFKHVPDAKRDDMVGFTVDQVVARGGGVVLFHDIHANTAATLPEIIDALTDRGFSFTNVDDLGVFPLLNEQEDPRGWIGDPCSAAEPDVCAFEVDGGTGFCHEFTAAAETHGFCSLPCEGFCPDRTGAPGTFCTSLDGGGTGQCVTKADPDNGDCEDIPGTVASDAMRFIGSSAAAASTARVCLPAPEGPSCVDLCGTTGPAPGSDPACFCDDTCADRGDCCSDFAAACG